MNFEETIEFLQQHLGKTVEVAVEVLVPTHLAGFWGQLGRLSKSGASGAPEAWYVWMRESDEASPFMDEFRLDRELFDDADVHANVVEEADERSESGATWTLTIHQHGFRITVEFYV
jgi:hypothetical protein